MKTVYSDETGMYKREKKNSDMYYSSVCNMTYVSGVRCVYLANKLKWYYFSVISRDILYEKSAPLTETHEELNKVRTFQTSATYTPEYTLHGFNIV